MNKTADVVVIGAGVIGCSIAYYLAKKGVKVIIIEKEAGLCFGASGANQGACIFQFESPSIDRLTKESAKLYGSLSKEIGYDVEYQADRLLICSVDEKQYSAVEKHAQAMCTSLIEGDEIRKLEPSLGRDVIAGIEQESGRVNPFKLNYGFAYAARKLGAEFLLSTEVKKFGINKGNITSVVTCGGRIKTNFVVNAAGAWSPEIGKMVGLIIPVKPQRGQIIVTEPVLLNERWRLIGDADFLTTDFNAKAVGKSKDPRVKLGVAGFYLQESGGDWTIGSSRDFASYNNQTTMQTLRHLAKRAIKFMPNLKDVNFIRTYAGLRPFCYLDGLPILSKVDTPSGFVIATGHAAEGVTLAPITGKLISELITEERTSIPIDAFTFSRFKNIN